jgi:hypothetical protein
MKNNDLILVNVVGTNPQSRQQKVVSRRFTGLGIAIDTEGQPTGQAPLNVAGMAGGNKAPDFPVAEYIAAQAEGKEQVDAVMLAHSERIAAWEKSGTGGSVELKLAKAVQEYCVENEGFIADGDGDGYILKLENLDVKVDNLPDNRDLWLVQGTAVFGA